MSESKRRARYTLEFKLEAVRLVKGGQAAFAAPRIGARLQVQTRLCGQRGLCSEVRQRVWQGRSQTHQRQGVSLRV